MSSLLSNNRLFEESTIALFFLRWIALPLMQQPSLITLLNIAPLFMVGGYYLSFFFVISHNFEGVALFGPAQSAQGGGHKYDSFLHKQVVTASNVGGSWLCFINGGLNYQIGKYISSSSLRKRLNANVFYYNFTNRAPLVSASATQSLPHHRSCGTGILSQQGAFIFCSSVIVFFIIMPIP